MCIIYALYQQIYFPSISEDTSLKNYKILITFLCMFIFIAFTAGILIGRTVGASNVLVSYSYKQTASTSENSTDFIEHKININTADETLLCELPGIGPSLAKKIIAYRNEHGRYSSINELTKISGIGEKILQSIADIITVEG